jgi:hypothetical protein
VVGFPRRLRTVRIPLRDRRSLSGRRHGRTSATDALHGIPLLGINDDVIQLAARLVADGGLPTKARVDALHVAVSTVHGMDYLLTWNCKHIANASLRGRIEGICKSSGFIPPVICTPFELPRE